MSYFNGFTIRFNTRNGCIHPRSLQEPMALKNTIIYLFSNNYNFSKIPYSITWIWTFQRFSFRGKTIINHTYPTLIRTLYGENLTLM